MSSAGVKRSRWGSAPCQTWGALISGSDCGSGGGVAGLGKSGSRVYVLVLDHQMFWDFVLVVHKAYTALKQE